MNQDITTPKQEVSSQGTNSCVLIRPTTAKLAEPTSAQQLAARRNIAMTALGEEEDDWERLNQTNWRGLGLTDPIKSVEVRLSNEAESGLSVTCHHTTRTNGSSFLLSLR
jgi:hypothetical protein